MGIRTEAEALVARGIPEGPLRTHKIEFRKATSGKLLHADWRCGHISRSYQVAKVPIAVLDVDEGLLCATCSRSQRDITVRTYIAAGRELLSRRSEVTEFVEKAAFRALTDEEVTRLMWISDKARYFREHPAFEELVPVSQEILDQAASIEVPSFDREAAVRLALRRSGVVLMYAGTKPSNPWHDIDVDIKTFDNDGYTWRSTNCILPIWEFWSGEVSAGKTDEEVASSLVSAADSVVGAEPRRFDQLPTTRYADPGGFPTGRDAAIADWRAARDEALTKACEQWSASLDRLTSNPDDQVIVAISSWDSLSESAVATKAMLRPFPHVERGDCQMLVARTPRIVATWLKVSPTRAQGAKSYIVTTAVPDDDESVLRCALGLFVPGGDGPTSALADTLRTARLIGSPNRETAT